MLLQRRFGWVSFFSLLAAAIGCSGEPPMPAPSPKPAASTPVASPAPPAVAAKDEAGFRPLALADFSTFQGKAKPDPPTWIERRGMIFSTGRPRGFLYSKRSYSNFTWRAELRFIPGDKPDPTAANTGFLVHIAEPNRIWPVCLEVQGKQPEIGMIKGNGKPNPLDPAKVHDHPEARQAAAKPIGEWNDFEIVSRDGKLSSFLNDKPICESDRDALTTGLIGIQAEDYPYELRNLRIREE